MSGRTVAGYGPVVTCAAARRCFFPGMDDPAGTHFLVALDPQVSPAGETTRLAAAPAKHWDNHLISALGQDGWNEAQLIMFRTHRVGF